MNGIAKLQTSLILHCWLIATCMLMVSDSVAHSPHHVIRSLAISPCFEQDQTLFHINEFPSREKILLRSTNAGVSWKRLVNGLENRWPLCHVSVSPDYKREKTVFVCSENSGIFKSSDGGQSWQKLADEMDRHKCHFLAISPNYSEDRTLLAACGDEGLFLSIDGGGKWSRVVPQGQFITTIAFSPFQQGRQVLYGDRDGGLYLSQNGGKKWQRIFSGPSGDSISSCAFSPSYHRDSIMIIGTGKNGLFLTRDGGHSFSPINHGLTDRSITSVAFSPAFNQDRTVFVSCWHLGVFRSTDAGKNWVLHAKGLNKDAQADEPRFLSPHFLQVRVSDGFFRDRTVFLGAFDGLFVSHDAGESWTVRETLYVKKIQGLAVSPDFKNEAALALVTVRGGVSLTKDGGRSWRTFNQGLHRTSIFDFLFAPDFAASKVFFCCSNFAFYYAQADDALWQRVDLKSRTREIPGKPGKHKKVKTLSAQHTDEGTTAPDSDNLPAGFPITLVASPGFKSDQTLFFGSRYEGIYKSDDAGKSWFRIWDANNTMTSALALSSGYMNDGSIFVGTYAGEVLKSTDRGLSWVQISKLAPNQFLRIALSPDYERDNTLFLGTIDGLMTSNDAGSTWQRAGTTGSDSPDIIIALALSPHFHNDRTLLTSVKGKGLFKSSDGGATLAPIAPDLIKQNQQIEEIEFSPFFTEDRTILATSEDELFVSRNAGETWSLISRPVRYENKECALHYEGTWQKASDVNLSGTTLAWSETPGDTIEFSFDGTGLDIISTTSDVQGIARIYIDGETERLLDQYDTRRQIGVVAFSKRNLEPGPHTLTIEVMNSRNPYAKGFRIELDAIDVIQ